jgi:hypothetical protein
LKNSRPTETVKSAAIVKPPPRTFKRNSTGSYVAESVDILADTSSEMDDDVSPHFLLVQFSNLYDDHYLISYSLIQNLL